MTSIHPQYAPRTNQILSFWWVYNITQPRGIFYFYFFSTSGRLIDGLEPCKHIPYTIVSTCVLTYLVGAGPLVAGMISSINLG